MKKHLIALSVLFYSHLARAIPIDFFRTADDHTDWQHVANFSSAILILMLSLAIIRLLFSRREVRRYNRQLETIRNQLEQRVIERTATLDESNRLLRESNRLLEGEIGQHRQTTDRLRSSEAYINNILHSMPSMLIGLNAKMEITQWNRRAEEITRIPSKKALGRDLWKTYPTITVPPEKIRQVQEQNKPLAIKHSQRGQYYFDITIYPLKDHFDTDVVILIDDVTQRILTENMLVQRDKMSSMGELAANMAHDIDTPLQSILQDIKSLQQDLSKDDDKRENIVEERILDALKKGQQASAVINNLLDFAGSRGGEKKLADVTGIIDHSIKLAGDLLSVPSGLKFRDVRIEKKYAANLPRIPCYVSELQQVFLSLFRHSCHALGEVDKPNHIPTIQIEVSEFYEALWVKVHHNGRGLSYDEQQNIFEPFFVNTSSNADYDAGKRLSFSYFIVTEQHRGQMAVTSDVNVGTTFHMQFQLQKT